MRLELPRSILDEKVIPVARRIDPNHAERLAEVLLAGGLSTLEITVEGEFGVASIAAVADSPLTVGAGTVTSLNMARAAVDAGARFVVAPHFDADVVAWANRQGIPVVPGGLTPTEVWTAWSSGASGVKVFPATTGGPGHLRSLLGPYPDLRLVPSGGIDGTNAAGFLEAGAVAVAVGGWLTASSDWALVADRVSQLREVV